VSEDMCRAWRQGLRAYGMLPVNTGKILVPFLGKVNAYFPSISSLSRACDNVASPATIPHSSFIAQSMISATSH
jgi:hypothetical protein